MNIKIFEKFKEEYYKKFPDSDLVILKPCDNWSNVFVQTKYGLCTPSIYHLMSGKIVSIRSAVNPTEYFINQAKEVHGDRYDYSITNISSKNEKFSYICKIHGIIEQSKCAHLIGRGCNACKYKIVSFKNGNNDSGGYTLTNWKTRGLKSKNFDDFKVYILQIWNNEECFYKIGRTFVTVKKRFAGKDSIPYNWRVLKIIKGDADYIYNLEIELKRKNKEFKHLPNIDFHGRHECFKELSNYDTL
jgi:hypothetical protein